MQIYLLKTTGALRGSVRARDDYNEYCNAQRMIILAMSEDQAREIASHFDDNEYDDYSSYTESSEINSPWWLDKNVTTCEVVIIKKSARIILASEPTG